jgi:osmotically-inducible protein OsmY
LDNLTVDVDSQGVVTLSGTVQDANHLATVTRLVTEVPGVQAVYTQAITVRSPEGNLPAIQKELENTLQAEGLHAAQVSIDSDSVVTLTGQVKDEQEKERALFIARSQKGVQGVGSRLREFQFVLTVPRHLENIPVRTDSSLGAQIIGAVDIPKGTKIPVMEAKGNWYKIWITIHAQEQVGWVPRSAVVPSSDMTKPNLQKVVQQARGALQTKGLYDVQVQIDTENMLILTGRVKDDHEEQLALAVTRAQPGIKGVINRLTNRTKVTVKNILGGSFE